MTRTQLILIAVLILLVSLFFYAVWKSGERTQTANDLIQNIHSHIHPGASRLEIEAYLQFLKAPTTFEAPVDDRSLGVERAILFDTRRVGSKRQDLVMEFYFSPGDVLQHYIVRPELVAIDAPRILPTPEPSTTGFSGSETENYVESPTDGQASPSPALEETPTPQGESPQPEDSATPEEPAAQD